MGMQGGMAMPQEQQSGEADHLMSQIQQKKSEWDMVRNVGNVRKKMSKMKLLEQFFSMMENNGIDPSNQQEVASFFEKLYQTNPDMYEMLTPIIDELLSDDEESSGEMETGEENGGMQGEQPLG